MRTGVDVGVHQERGEVLGVDDLALARQLPHGISERWSDDEEPVALVGGKEEALAPPDDLVVGDVAEVRLEERAAPEFNAVAPLALVVHHGEVALGEGGAFEVCFVMGGHALLPLRNEKGLQ